MNFIDRNIILTTGVSLISGATLIYIIVKSISMVDIANETLRLIKYSKSIPEKFSFQFDENINYFEIKFNKNGKNYNILLHKDESSNENTYEIEFENEKKSITLPDKMPINLDVNKIDAKCITRVSKDGTRVIIQENINYVDFYDE